MKAKELDPKRAQIFNYATRTVVSTIGALLGISSIDHGALEMMQGNRPTPGFLIKAQGPGHSWSVWTQGSEPAFTLVHNFLLTGALATLAGFLLVAWSLRFIHRKRGATAFLLLSVTSYLLGGGLAQVLLFTLNWAAATRIRAGLGFWKWLLPVPFRRILGGFWPWTLAVGAIAFLLALEIATFGYCPGVPRDQQVLYHFLIQLGAVIVIAILLSFVGGFSSDIEGRARLEKG
jgi:hypothetical protein